jgi:dolichol-phosphate mannosyltransferase
MSRIICVLPTYNEAKNITLLLDKIFQLCPAVDVLVVDDNSPDGTAEIVKKNIYFQSKLFLLQRSHKSGLGPAYIAGFQYVIEKSYDYAVQMDADFSHRAEDLIELIQCSSENKNSVIIGSRWISNGQIRNWSYWRRIISWGGNLFARLMLGQFMLGQLLSVQQMIKPLSFIRPASSSCPVVIRDWTGGFNLWPVDVLKKCIVLPLESHGYAFQIELKYIALGLNFSLIEVPIIFEERKWGDSKMSLRIIGEAFWKVIGFKRKYSSFLFLR